MHSEKATTGLHLKISTTTLFHVVKNILALNSMFGDLSVVFSSTKYEYVLSYRDFPCLLRIKSTMSPLSLAFSLGIVVQTTTTATSIYAIAGIAEATS